MVREKEGYALFNISRNEKRENLDKWVGPLQTDSVCLYENSKNPTNISSLDDISDSMAVCVI